MYRIRCCKDCTERVLGCHSTCEKYLNEKKINRELKEKEFQYQEIMRSIQSVRYSKTDKLKKHEK